jgi:hypothetical protein
VSNRSRLPCAPDDPELALKKTPPSPREHSRLFPKERPSILPKNRMWHSRICVPLLHKIRSWQTRNGVLVIQNNRRWHPQFACPGCVPRIFWTTGRPFLVANLEISRGPLKLFSRGPPGIFRSTRRLFLEFHYRPFFRRGTLFLRCNTRKLWSKGNQFSW